jgi:hypothetical protein
VGYHYPITLNLELAIGFEPMWGIIPVDYRSTAVGLLAKPALTSFNNTAHESGTWAPGPLNAQCEDNRGTRRNHHMGCIAEVASIAVRQCAL